MLLNQRFAPGILGITGGVLPFQAIVRWEGVPIEFDLEFDDNGDVVQDEELLVIDTREALNLSFINPRWLFPALKQWIP